MCGRYTLVTDVSEIPTEFEAELESRFEFKPNFNVTPTSQVPVVYIDDRGRRMATLMRWGLVPRFSREIAGGTVLNNARSETAHEKPSFRDNLRQRRCLVPVSGFYEWKPAQDSLSSDERHINRDRPQSKIPYYIHLKGHRLFAFAGIWDEWTRGGQSLRSFSILTTSPNRTMSEIHDRMPVIIDRVDYGAWLTRGGANWDFSPREIEELEAYPVSSAVNSPRNNRPELLTPV